MKRPFASKFPVADKRFSNIILSILSNPVNPVYIILLHTVSSYKLLKPDFIGSNRRGGRLDGSGLVGAGDSTFCPVVLRGAGRDRKEDYNRKLIRIKQVSPLGAHAPRERTRLACEVLPSQTAIPSACEVLPH